MEYLNLRKAAADCGVKVRTMREWVRTGKIAAVKSDNNWYWLVAKSEVERIVNGHKS